MKFNFKESRQLKSIASKLKTTSLEIVELAAKNSLTLWTSYQEEWIMITSSDLNYITTKATKAFKLEGNYTTSRGKKISISSFMLILDELDDLTRPIEALSMANQDILELEKLFNMTPLKHEVMEKVVKTEIPSNEGSGKHWERKRESIRSAAIRQINLAVMEGDNEIFKTRKDKKSINMTRVAQRIVDFNLSMSELASFSKDLTVDKIKDVLRPSLDVQE